jgi:small conductance mechanosensitive channel
MAQSVPIAHTATVPTPDFWTQMQVLLVDGGLKLVIAVLILAAGWILATWVKRWIEAALAHLPLDLTLKPLLASLVRYAILVLTFILVLGQFGVQTTSLIAVMGAAGLAIGLAMQGTLSNVAAGVMLLILRPFRVGQFVEVGGKQGTVREIGLFTTLLITRDNIYVSMPNSSIFGATIINYTRERTRRVKFLVPVDYFNDLELVEKTIVATLNANALVLKEPPASAVVQELQEYTVLFAARAMVRSPDYWKALYALQKEVAKALAKADILLAVTRQAAVTRNEPLSRFTESPDAQPAPPPAENRHDGAGAPQDRR